jgi:predicted DCC family thiol-disulfide oxidoreductase YuxK
VSCGNRQKSLGIDPNHPDSFAFLAAGQAYVKSEAALRIVRELPHWQWTRGLPLDPAADPRRGLRLDREQQLSLVWPS